MGGDPRGSKSQDASTGPVSSGHVYYEESDRDLLSHGASMKIRALKSLPLLTVRVLTLSAHSHFACNYALLLSASTTTREEIQIGHPFIRGWDEVDLIKRR